MCRIQMVYSNVVCVDVHESKLKSKRFCVPMQIENGLNIEKKNRYRVSCIQ